MRKAAALALLIAALGCGSSDQNPLLGGGGGGGGSSAGPPDAGTDTDAGPVSLVLAGIVCEVQDFRQPSPCIDLPEGVEVALAGTTSVDDTDETDSMGLFYIELDYRPSFVDLTVTDPNGILRQSIVRLPVPATGDLDQLALPVLSPSSMLAIESGLGEGPTDAVGVVVGLVNRDGGILGGAAVVEQPAGTLGGTYYDSNAFPYVDIGASTGDDGIFAIFAVPVVEPTVSFSLTPSSIEDPLPLSAPVAEGAITYVTYDLPTL
jgi:hypothetical protein